MHVSELQNVELYPNKGSLTGLNPCSLAGPTCLLGEVPGAEACSLRLFLCNSGIQWAKRDSLQHDWKIVHEKFGFGQVFIMAAAGMLWIFPQIFGLFGLYKL